jgi:chromate transporter
MWDIFKTFFKIGMFTFGGGYAMIPLIEEQVVKEKAWLTTEEFMELLSVSQGLPGAMAVNVANFIGFKRMGFRGLLMACLGTVLPSFSIILCIAFLINKMPIMKYLQPVMDGMLPAIAVMIIFSAYKLGSNLQRNWSDGVLLVVGLGLLIGFGVNPVWVILGGIVLGILRSVMGHVA